MLFHKKGAWSDFDRKDSGRTQEYLRDDRNKTTYWCEEARGLKFEKDIL